MALQGGREKANVAKTLQWARSVEAQLGGDMVGSWNFNEGTGTTAYDATGYNNGTLGNGACTPSATCPALTPGNPCPCWTDGVQGLTGKALYFDGNDDYVNAGNGASLQTNSFTQEWWMKSNNVSVYQMPLSQVSGTYYGFYQSLSYSGYPNTIRMWLANGSGYDELLSSASITQNNQWYHVALTYDNTTKLGSIYINGVLDISKTFTLGFSPSPTNLNIGRYVNDGMYFNGTIDEVRIYSRALTALEIQKHYAESAPRHLFAEK